jgi:hypothetical protein
VGLFNRGSKQAPSESDGATTGADHLVRLGDRALRAGRAEEAADHYQLALNEDISQVPVYPKLGNALARLGKFEDAMAVYQRSISLDPDHAPGHVGLGTLLLRQGEYRKGWPHFEWRQALPPMSELVRHLPGPAWKGEPLEGKTILLYHEQSLSDSIQFIRYAPRVAARGATVIVACPRKLERIFADVPGVSMVVADGDAVPPIHTHASLMSLPNIFETTLDTVPGEMPYLGSGDVMIPMTPPRPGEELCVGLTWAGDPHYSEDMYRSCPFAALVPLMWVEGLTFYCVQTGDKSMDLWGARGETRMIDMASSLRDLATTATIIDQLDIVITVDTAVAQIAGAMGKPVWVALPFSCDWRWGLSGEQTPWYPSMRLFRQREPDDWSGPIKNMATRLETIVSARRGANQACTEQGQDTRSPAPATVLG